MVVELVSVGTEILMGNIVNTNAQFLAEKCANLGLMAYYQTVVGDNHDRMAAVIRTALDRSDIVIISGGLGPTEDDMTKEVCAEVMGCELKEDEHSRNRIQEYFDRITATEVTNNNWKQALAPKGAIVLDNENGTAPGYILEKDGKTAILLPGPPDEMIPMFMEQVYPYLQARQPEVFYTRIVKVCGIGESRLETEILDLIENQTNPTIATYAKVGEVHVRITAKAETEELAKQLVKPVVKEIKQRLGDYVYATKEQVTLEKAVVKLLEKYDLKVTTAESCTGGLLAGRLLNVPGASDVFKEGFITYSNKAKRKYLDVNKSTIKKYTAVSEEVAKEMAIGGVFATDCDACVAVTGLAGPGGGTEEKPVGLVYIATYMKDSVKVKEYHFKGDRAKIRQQAVVKALDLLRRSILENYR